MKIKYPITITENEELDREYYYEGDDLGVTIKKDKTAFRIWSPYAMEMRLNLYKEGDGENLICQHSMKSAKKGTFYLEIPENLSGVYYTYTVIHKDSTYETPDPYAKAAGVNGDRSMILDLKTTEPEDWGEDRRPEFLSPTDGVIYELHVRDLSVDVSSGINHKGKFLGLIEEGTKNNKGHATGIDHIKELGITHLHLLPSFDFATVDESRPEKKQFNWGYDPKNYNVPEGSYSTDAVHGEVRIKELKKVIKKLHEKGIRVILDVVYNHTAKTEGSIFNCVVPGYYYRNDKDVYANGSACGNEVASERLMVRKYILDSVIYWAKEYHIDGFRFDLMGLHDIETMETVRKELDKIDDTILVYGEGWIGGDSPLPEEKRASKANINKVKGIAAFSNDLRDSIKGSIFESEGQGFVNGGKGLEEGIKFGIVAATSHKGVDKTPWADGPAQCINYVSAHDDLTLWDKLSLSASGVSEAKRIKMNKLAAAIVITSQGIPFLHAGEELLRSKPSEMIGVKFEQNSYKSSDRVNSIKWDDKTKHLEVFQYYQGLIAFRKSHPQLRMTSQKQIDEQLEFFQSLPPKVIAYHITGNHSGGETKEICVIFNAKKIGVTVDIPKGTWQVYIDNERAGVEPLWSVTGGYVKVPMISALVLERA